MFLFKALQLLEPYLITKLYLLLFEFCQLIIIWIFFSTEGHWQTRILPCSPSYYSYYGSLPRQKDCHCPCLKGSNSRRLRHSLSPSRSPLWLTPSYFGKCSSSFASVVPRLSTPICIRSVSVLRSLHDDLLPWSFSSPSFSDRPLLEATFLHWLDSALGSRSFFCRHQTLRFDSPTHAAISKSKGQRCRD